MKLISRCSFLAAGAAVLLFTTTANASDALQAKTDNGKLEGKMSADGQVRDFLGIPFAAPPVGPLRWKPPQPAAKWHGVRQATSFGAHCMQASSYPDMIFRDPGASEDCLNLNVWTPVAKGKQSKHEKLPVMVWIYGGGFAAGGTSEARQDGEHLADKGVIVVSMNYRLGILGFFALPELAAESPQHAAGNYGFMDQVAALQWVKKNIEAFGGDPAKVTIFGESAGSISVSAQMASPMAQGLYIGAIGESGGALGNIGASFAPLSIAEEHDQQFAQSIGKASLADLRAMPADALMRAAHQAHANGFRLFWPDIDGTFLPESPAAIYAEGKQAHVPLLAGWNKDEQTFTYVLHHDPPTQENVNALAQKDFGPLAGEFLKAYAPTPSEDLARATSDYAGDKFIAFSTWAWLEAQVKTGQSPVYRYRFDLGSPGDPYHPQLAGAFHSDDIEYVFGNLDSRRGAKWRPEDYKLSNLMQSYWTNFARTGSPDGGGVPEWPKYDEQGGWQVMHLGPDPEPRPDRYRDRYLFLEQSWGIKSSR